MPGLIHRLFAKKQNLPPDRIGRDIQRRQQLLADALQRASKKLSRKTLSVFLFIYCTAFGFAFLVISINAFKKDNDPLSINPITVSKSANGPVENRICKVSGRTKESYKTELSIDSIRRYYDKARPPNGLESKK
jgi:hypothetical protein